MGNRMSQYIFLYYYRHQHNRFSNKRKNFFSLILASMTTYAEVLMEFQFLFPEEFLYFNWILIVN